MTNPTAIRDHFGAIALRYDLVNAFASLGLHLHWNKRLIKQALLRRGPLLDLCAGTGAITAGYLRCAPLEKVYLLDYCPQMLAVAKGRISSERASFLEADAQEIPLPNHSIAVCTCAYGIRNISDPKRCAAEVARVLKPGGIWAILELTRPASSLLYALHRFHLKATLPLIGALCTGRPSAYRYLATSIASLQPPQALAHSLTAEGFVLDAITPLSGGIATLITLQSHPYS